MERVFDVLIIGAGVIGCSAARELSQYDLSIGVLEKGPDVCVETSSRNSAVLHAGYNNRPGSKMARFCVEGNRTFDEVAAELDIPYRRTGKLIVGFTDEDREKLLSLKATGEENGIEGMELVDRAFIDSKAPAVKGNFALWSPTTGILSPFQFTFGMAENAAANGVSFFFDSEVTGITCPEPSEEKGWYEVRTEGRAGEHSPVVRKTFRSRWVINCAGLFADKISSMLGIDDYTIYPCRGEYFITDRKLGEMLPLPAYPVPNYRTGGLGIHMTPTLDGNIMIGPSNEYIDGREDYACTRVTMDMLLVEGEKILPRFKPGDFIRNFSGIRPKLVPKAVGGYHDFVIERRADVAPHAVNLVGIESPGLTSAVPISKEIVRLMQEAEDLVLRKDFNPIRRRFETFRDKSPERQAELIRENPDYGEVICRCETITRAEILAAIRAVPGARTMTGIKYRVRTMMGRCQGGYCMPRVAEILREELGIGPEELTFSRRGSWMFPEE